MALLPRRPSVDPKLPRRGDQQAVGQLNQGRLSAAVGAQQTHNPARFNGKADSSRAVTAPKRLLSPLHSRMLMVSLLSFRLYKCDDLSQLEPQLVHSL